VKISGDIKHQYQRRSMAGVMVAKNKRRRIGHQWRQHHGGSMAKAAMAA